MSTETTSKSSSFFLATDQVISAIPWILLVIAGYILFWIKDKVWHDLSLSYVSGMIVYLLTVVLPDAIRHIKLKRYVINELATLYNDYKDLLWTISKKAPCEDSYSLDQIRKELEQYNCRRQSYGICLSNRTIDILKPKCKRILYDTSLLLSKQKAFSVEQLLVIHEITQVWFLKDIASMDDGCDYYQSRNEMMNKAEYLVERFNDLQTLYFKLKRQINLTIGWHPARRN